MKASAAWMMKQAPSQSLFQYDNIGERRSPLSLAAEQPSEPTLAPSKAQWSWWIMTVDRYDIIETAKDLEYHPICQASLQENSLAGLNPAGAYYEEPLDSKKITQDGEAPPLRIK